LLKGFGNVFVRELKELIRDPKILLGMIIIPAIIFPVIGGILNYAMQFEKEKAERATLLVVNNDGEDWSNNFIDFLNFSTKVSIENKTTITNDVALDLLSKYNTTQFIEIPEGFSANITEHVTNNRNVTAAVKFYCVFSGAGIFEGVGSSMIDNFVNLFNRYIAPDVLDTEKSTIIKGEIKLGVDPALLSSLMYLQTIAMPITIMILLIYAMQIAATTVAMEKEEKTLETLLTLPIDRFAILMGKLSSSIFVAGVGALAYMVGYNYLLQSSMATIPTGTTLDLVSLGLVPSVFGYLLLGISLFATLLSALALAVIISAFAEDVRSAQSLVGYIWPLFFIPTFVLMYLDVNSLPFTLKILIYAIPYSHTLITSKAITMGDYLTPLLGIVYVATFTLVLLYTASRLFATERILTAKLKFKGLRRRQKTVAEGLQ